MKSQRPFHLAFPVRDLESTRRFYVDLLGCAEGRSGDDWVDIDFFGNQIVAHVMARFPLAESGVNRIDGHDVPLPHFGAVLAMDQWRKLTDRLREGGVTFLIEPHVRYEGRFQEQASMIFHDPSGNVIEFKSFADDSKLFGST